MKFRKKPIVIDAIRSIARVKIKTLEGELMAEIGDWIITGVNGELYPCKPDIFAKTYEPADPNICPKRGGKQMGDRQLNHFYDRRLAYVMITTALLMILFGLLGV